jgi:CheY-like chemotaxis protein
MATSVLVVDDDPSAIRLAVRVLADIEVEVAATAGDAATAIQAANSTKPDAALVDIGLPDCDGIDLAYELAALPWRPRVVLMSSDIDAVNGIESRAGRDPLPFLPKQELTDGRLRRLLASE